MCMVCVVNKEYHVTTLRYTTYYDFFPEKEFLKILNLMKLITCKQVKTQYKYKLMFYLLTSECQQCFRMNHITGRL